MHPMNLITETQAAFRIGLSTDALRARRLRAEAAGVDPELPYVRVGPRCIRYRLGDVERYAKECYKSDKGR